MLQKINGEIFSMLLKKFAWQGVKEIKVEVFSLSANLRNSNSEQTYCIQGDAKIKFEGSVTGVKDIRNVVAFGKTEADAVRAFAAKISI